MENGTENEGFEGKGAARRIFLKQVAATGVMAGALAPAVAQETKAERPWMTQAAPGQALVADALARYAATLKYEDLPPDVIRTAKRTILDTIGCAIGGHTEGPSQIALKLAANVSAKQPATVLCTGLKTSADLAVFANGVMIRCLDFNDGYISLGSGHPSDTLAALLPTAEIAGRNGRDLILGTVIAYEAFCKVADVLDIRGIGIDHSTVIGLAASVGASRQASAASRTARAESS